MPRPPAQPTFPEGSIIVREKLKTATSKNPEVLAVMMKRGKGFNPAANDWEFLIVNSSLTKIKKRQKTGECQSCHAPQVANDFVFSFPATLRLENPPH